MLGVRGDITVSYNREKTGGDVTVSYNREKKT